MVDSSPEGELSVDVAGDGSVTVVRVAGEVDADTRGVLVDALTPVYEHGPGHTVVFDLAETSFMDSSGLAVLISATRDGRSVLLRKPSEAVLLLVEATGLADLLPVEP